MKIITVKISFSVERFSQLFVIKFYAPCILILFCKQFAHDKTVYLTMLSSLIFFMNSRKYFIAFLNTVACSLTGVCELSTHVLVVVWL